MTRGPTRPVPDAGLPELGPGWSRLVPVADGAGGQQTWHVLDNGVAPTTGTLLCVHGNPTWSYLWRRLLAAAPPGWRVVAPDQLGMGWSDPPPAETPLAERVAQLGRLTAALGLTGPVVCVAHDWGGPVSLGWAALHRHQLRGVVLLNTAVHQPPHSPRPLLFRLARRPALRTLVCVRTPTFVRAATALSRPALPRAVRDAFAAPYGTAGRRACVGSFVADIPFEPAHPSRPTLDRIAEDTRTLDVPALLLWGPRDPVFRQAHLDDLCRRLPRAAVHRYERASHLVSEDAPEYAAAVGRWLGTLDAATEAPPGSQGPTPQGPTPQGPTPQGPTPQGPTPQGERWSPLERLDARAADRSPAVVQVGRAPVGWDLLHRRVHAIAHGLRAAGVRPGQRVALLVPPSPELTAAVYALWRAGAVVVVVDRGLGLRGMGRALRGARVDHVVGGKAGLVAARAMRLPGSRIAVGPVPRPLRSALGVEWTLAGLAEQGRDEPPLPARSAGDECAVVFTSGATGPAKGVVYRHAQLRAQLAQLRAAYALRDDDGIVAAFAPFSLYGPALGVASVVPDMDVTSPRTLTASALADAVAAIAATVVFASPAALRGVLGTASRLSAGQRAALGGVRLLISAGAPVPAALLTALARVLPSAQLHTPYGMTEVLPVTDISLAGIEAAGRGDGVCVGRPLAGVDVAVSPLSDSGAAVGPLTANQGRTGEVCVRADHVKDTYDARWDTQQASARDPGWHRTGDVGHLDREGRLWIEGRLEHVVSTAHGVVTPVGVEQRVESLDTVRSAAAVGVGPVGTQQVTVVVVPAGPTARWSRRLAPPTLAGRVRSAAGVPLAAVLLTRTLPVDVRHASKVDRRRVAGWAEDVLAGRRARARP